jgi:hypothetical protein
MAIDTYTVISGKRNAAWRILDKIFRELGHLAIDDNESFIDFVVDALTDHLKKRGRRV